VSTGAHALNLYLPQVSFMVGLARPSSLVEINVGRPCASQDAALTQITSRETNSSVFIIRSHKLPTLRSDLLHYTYTLTD